MSNEITARVVNVTFHEQALTEINEVSNHFTRAGFVLTLNDEEGSPHELGTNTFGLLSGQTAEEVKALSAGSWRKRPLAARRKSLWPHSPSG